MLLHSLQLLTLSLGRGLFPTLQLLLLLPSANLFLLYLTFPVLVVSFFEVFTVLFPQVSHSTGFSRRFSLDFSIFRRSVVSFPHSDREPTQFGCGASSWMHGWAVFSLSVILE